MTAKHTITTKLVTITLSGNLNDVARYVTKLGLADFYVQADCDGGSSTVLFRLPADWPVDGRGPLSAEAAGRSA